MSVDQFQRKGPKFGRTLMTAESEPVCPTTPERPATNVVTMETAKPMAPKISPFFHPSTPYHHARMATTITAKMIKTMDCGVNKPVAPPTGTRAAKAAITVLKKSARACPLARRSLWSSNCRKAFLDDVPVQVLEECVHIFALARRAV